MSYRQNLPESFGQEFLQKRLDRAVSKAVDGDVLVFPEASAIWVCALADNPKSSLSKGIIGAMSDRPLTLIDVTFPCEKGTDVVRMAVIRKPSGDAFISLAQDGKREDRTLQFPPGNLVVVMSCDRAGDLFLGTSFGAATLLSRYVGGVGLYNKVNRITYNSFTNVLTAGEGDLTIHFDA